MKKLLFVLVLSICGAVSVSAQKADDAKAALTVVNQLFAEMAAANPAGILALGTPENQLVALRRMKDGKSRIDVINGGGLF